MTAALLLTLGVTASSLVTVVARDPRGKELARGPAVFISKDGQLLASGHILHRAASARVETAAGAVFEAKGVVAESVSSEIVRLAVDLPPSVEVAPAVLASTPLEKGQRVSVAGSEGVVSAVRSVPDFGSIFLLTAKAGPNVAGAPVFNAAGEVAGVALWESPPENTVFAAAIEPLMAPGPGPLKSIAEWNAGRMKPEAESLYREGLSLLFLEDFEGALDRFAGALEKDPRSAAAAFYSGFAHGKLGRVEDKLAAFRDAVRIKPDWAEAHYSLGVSYALLGRGTPARRQHAILAKLDPRLAEKLEILIDALTHEGHDDEHPPKPPPAKTTPRALLPELPATSPMQSHYPFPTAMG
mgnify:CR=1 FL=1